LKAKLKGPGTLPKKNSLPPRNPGKNEEKKGEQNRENFGKTFIKPEFYPIESRNGSTPWQEIPQKGGGGSIEEGAITFICGGILY